MSKTNEYHYVRFALVAAIAATAIYAALVFWANDAARRGLQNADPFEQLWTRSMILGPLPGTDQAKPPSEGNTEQAGQSRPGPGSETPVLESQSDFTQRDSALVGRFRSLLLQELGAGNEILTEGTLSSTKQTGIALLASVLGLQADDVAKTLCPPTPLFAAAVAPCLNKSDAANALVAMSGRTKTQALLEYAEEHSTAIMLASAAQEARRGLNFIVGPVQLLILVTFFVSGAYFLSLFRNVKHPAPPYLSNLKKRAEFLSGIVVMLGFIGTVWGIFIAIPYMAQVLGGPGIDQGGAISAMALALGPAFSTTLMAFAATIVLTWMQLEVEIRAKKNGAIL